MKNKKIIYYWASNEDNNNGEGILANNFIDLVKTNYKNFKIEPINKIKNINQETIFFKYILPFWGVIKLWKYYVLGKKICYVNFLPAWNFLLIILLPPTTIIGPVTGSINRFTYNKLLKFFTLIGLKILKIRFKKIIFSHDFFIKYIEKDEKRFLFNFLLYNFKISKESRIKKKYDIIFYIRKHQGKRNEFLVNIISELSYKYKICILGEKIQSNKNIYNMGYVNRRETQKLIKFSKSAVSTYENLFSYFLLDCLKYKLSIFYNSNFKLNNNISSNFLFPINFNNLNKSLKIIENNFNKKNKKKIFYKKKNFNSYFEDL